MFENEFFIIESTNEINEEIISLCERFDQYIEALDSGYFEAKRKNENIVLSLKTRGVTNFTIKNYEPIYSEIKRDWKII